LTFTVNVYGIQLLPAIQMMGGICHVVFFVALIVPLVLLAPRSTPDFVFTAFLNEGGWKSDGVSWCVGLLTVTFCFMGKLLMGRRREVSLIDPFSQASTELSI
jgi:choline transport protein